MGFGQCNDFHRQSLTKGCAWCVPSLPLIKRSWADSLSVEIIISISNDFVSYRTTVWYKFTVKIYISSSWFEHFACFFSFGFSLLLEFKYNFPFCYLIRLYSYLFFCFCCASLCPSLCDSMDYSPLGSSVHAISQARILEWVAISFSRRPPWPQGLNPCFLCLLHCRWILYLLNYQGSPTVIYRYQ